MRYRAYRRKCKKNKLKRLGKIADFSGYPTPAVREDIKDDEPYVNPFLNNRDRRVGTYVKRIYRGNTSSYLKKQYAKKLRNGKLKYIRFKGCEYKKASGDFWWDYC